VKPSARSLASGLAVVSAVALAFVVGWFVLDEVRIRREIRRVEAKYPGLLGRAA